MITVNFTYDDLCDIRYLINLAFERNGIFKEDKIGIRLKQDVCYCILPVIEAAIEDYEKNNSISE